MFALGVSLISCIVIIDICMCVVNKQFERLKFVFDSVYVDLQYDEISLTFNAGSVSLCCVCVCLWSVCEVVVVPYVDSVVAVMRVLLFVCLLSDCDGARLTAMLVWGIGECRACVVVHMVQVLCVWRS